MLAEAGIPVILSDRKYGDNTPRGVKTASVSVSTEYCNLTPKTIYIKNQANVVIAIEPNQTRMNLTEMRGCLEVKTIYSLYTNDSIVKTYEVISAMEKNGQLLSDDCRALREKLFSLFRDDPSSRNKNNFVFTVINHIDEDHLKNGAVFFMREQNVMVSYERVAMMEPHPFSPEGMQHVDVTSRKEYRSASGVFVKVVDNHQLCPMRYMYAGKNLIAVPSIIDSTKESGVYCTISTAGADGISAPTTEFMSFEEAQQKIGLFKSQEEAISNGDPELILKNQEAANRKEEKRLSAELLEAKHVAQVETIKNERKLTELKHSLELVRAENESLKESLAVRKTVRDDSYQIVQAERKDRYEERKDRYDDIGIRRKHYYDDIEDRRRDYYEERSYRRKDQSEFMKYAPSFVIGLLTAFTLYQSKKA